MPLMPEKQVVECVKQKNDSTKYGIITWLKLSIGNRYIMPKELAESLQNEGFVKIIEA